MIYIYHDNIFVRCNKYHTIIDVPNNTGYLPLRAHNNILLMSDGKLYTVSRNNKLSVLSSKQRDETTEFNDSFAKINSEYYEICEPSLLKIPIVANSLHNIKKVWNKNGFYSDDYYYFYVNIHNELISFYMRHEIERHVFLDNDVSLILSYNFGSKCIIYVKGGMIVCSYIYNFTYMTYSYIVDYEGSSIIKSSCSFMLDSHNNLYALIMDNVKFVTKKISSDVIDFYCDANYAYITDASNMIYCIDKKDYNSKYIDVGHFEKTLVYNKSAKNVYVCE